MSELKYKEGTIYLGDKADLGGISAEVVDNPEFSEVETDSDGMILGGRKSDGKKFENAGFETKSIDIDGNAVETCNSSEFIEVTIDEEGKVINGTTAKGEGIVGGVNVNHLKGEVKQIAEQAADKSKLYLTSRFIQISDTHCVPSDPEIQNSVNNEQRMQLMVDMVNSQQKLSGLDFVVSTGDNVVTMYSNGNRVDPLPGFKEQVVDKINARFFPCVGNHDACSDEEWYNAFGVPKQYSVSINDIYLIVLNVYRGSIDWSYWPEHPSADEKGYIPGSVAEEEHLTINRDFRFTTIDTDFLEEQLQIAARMGKKPVTAVHTIDCHSAVDQVAAQNSVNRFFELCMKYNCHLGLFGHSHIISNEYAKTYDLFTCNPGWFGKQNDSNYNTSPWAINLFSNVDGYFSVSNIVLGWNYVDTPRLGNVEASVNTLPMYKEEVKRATYNY